MSTELKTIKNTGVEGVNLNITQFWGGGKKGIMTQLTQGLGGILGADEPGYIQLTIKDACKVGIELMRWIKNQAIRKR